MLNFWTPIMLHHSRTSHSLTYWLGWLNVSHAYAAEMCNSSGLVYTEFSNILSNRKTKHVVFNSAPVSLKIICRSYFSSKGNICDVHVSIEILFKLFSLYYKLLKVHSVPECMQFPHPSYLRYLSRILIMNSNSYSYVFFFFFSCSNSEMFPFGEEF